MNYCPELVTSNIAHCIQLSLFYEPLGQENVLIAQISRNSLECFSPLLKTFKGYLPI